MTIVSRLVASELENRLLTTDSACQEQISGVNAASRVDGQLPSYTHLRLDVRVGGVGQKVRELTQQTGQAFKLVTKVVDMLLGSDVRGQGVKSILRRR